MTYLLFAHTSVSECESFRVCHISGLIYSFMRYNIKVDHKDDQVLLY